MAEKLFNEYYTKKFDLPGRFTALNGAIQYFELTASVALDEDTAVSQANYLRVLEVLRSRGAQPIITHVDGTKVGFTLEQTWVYGKRGALQVSDHYEDGKADEEKKLAGLTAGAVADIKAAFGIGDGLYPVKALKEVDGEIVDDDKDLFAFVEVKTTAGSLNANHA